MADSAQPVRKWLGRWWLPDTPGEKVPGELVVDGPHRMRLTLQGVLGQILSGSPSKRIPIILGETASAETLTLEECLQVELRSVSRDIFCQSQVLSARFAVLGKHYPRDEEVGETTLELTLPALQEWCDKWRIGNTEQKLKDAKIEYSRPDDILVPSSRDPFEVTFATSFDPGRFTATLSQSAVAVFASKDRISLRELGRLVRNLSDFLTFVSQEKASLAKASYVLPEEVAWGYHERAEVLTPFNEVPVGAVVPAYRMLFSLTDIGEERFPRVWNEWCRIEKDIRPALHYYLHELSDYTPYTFIRILDLSRALEVWHRKATAGKKFKCLLDRMKNTWERQPATIRKILGDKEAFARLAADARNYHTHYNRIYNPEIETEVILAARLRILMTSILLQELGFSEAEIGKMATEGLRSNAFQLPTVVK